ncbi:hypothetical protein J7J26_03680 [Candidatus Micrarchaeota archaeon]|nr:hypothetical protein [Candidatus Micrarchaeota archaeon]
MSIKDSNHKMKFQNHHKRNRSKHEHGKHVRNLLSNTAFLLIVFIVLLAIYIKTQLIYLGLLSGLLLLYIFFKDIKGEVKSYGWKRELKEIIIAIIIALAIWFGLCFILGTQSPLNAVVSCSMLPNLQRGDLIILRGGSINAQHVVLDNVDDITSKGVVYLNNIDNFNGTNNKTEMKLIDVNGSILSYCSFHSSSDICTMLRSSPDSFKEKHGPLIFRYGVCTRKNLNNNMVYKTVCVKEASINNITVNFNDPAYESYDTIVYTPKKTDAFSKTGDIIHRAIFEIATKKGTYYLTKGDNNDRFDIQMYAPSYGSNSIVSQSQLKGKIFLRIPYIGYVKLVLFGMVSTPQGCESQFI